MTQTTVRDPMGYPFEPEREAGRTSLLAIASLILSILCVTAPLGVLLSIAAMIGITRSGGRVRGMGLAVTGLIVGLIATTCIGGFVGGGIYAFQFWDRSIAKPVAASLESLEAGDFSAARNVFDSTTAAALTDGQLAAFTAAYRTELGEFKGLPVGAMETLEALSLLGPQMEKHQSSPGAARQLIPIPGKFEQGLALIVVELDPQNAAPGTAGGPPEMLISNILIVTQGGKTIQLSDFGPDGARRRPGEAAPANGPASPGEAPPPTEPPASPTPPADPDTPDDDGR